MKIFQGKLTCVPCTVLKLDVYHNVYEESHSPGEPCPNCVLQKDLNDFRVLCCPVYELIHDERIKIQAAINIGHEEEKSPSTFKGSMGGPSTVRFI